MLLCLALQIAYAKQMQNAECRMQMQNALQMQIALHMQMQMQRRAITLEQLRSQTACAPEALGRIQTLRAFRRTQPGSKDVQVSAPKQVSCYQR